MADVLIVGGGIMGCTIAGEVALDGADVTVLERSVPGAEASSAAAGILAPGIEEGDVLMSLARASLDRYAHLAQELSEQLGIDVGFRRSGLLRVAFDAQEREQIAASLADLPEQRWPFEWLDAKAARAAEPSLHDGVIAAVSLPQEAQIEPKVLLRALALSAERHGARFRTDAVVRRVVVEDGRAIGVELGAGPGGPPGGAGETLRAKTIVVAAGSWTSLVPGLPAQVVVEPVRGQIVESESRPPIFSRIVLGRGGYVVTRPDGRLLAGSTEERAGFRRDVTFGGMVSVLGIAVGLAPALRDAPVRGYWSSFRPSTADGLPYVGVCGEGLLVAAGHFRSGIMLAPVTAAIVASLAKGEPPDVPPPLLAAIDPKRAVR